MGTRAFSLMGEGWVGNRFDGQCCRFRCDYRCGMNSCSREQMSKLSTARSKTWFSKTRNIGKGSLKAEDEDVCMCVCV